MRLGGGRGRVLVLVVLVVAAVGIALLAGWWAGDDRQRGTWVTVAATVAAALLALVAVVWTALEADALRRARVVDDRRRRVEAFADLDREPDSGAARALVLSALTLLRGDLAADDLPMIRACAGDDQATAAGRDALVEWVRTGRGSLSGEWDDLADVERWEAGWRALRDHRHARAGGITAWRRETGAVLARLR